MQEYPKHASTSDGVSEYIFKKLSLPSKSYDSMAAHCAVTFIMHEDDPEVSLG